MTLAMTQRPVAQVDTPKGVVVRNCKVTSIHDGDSMRVRCPGFRKTLPIRLDQIDAPELDQSYGTKSRDFLRSLCPLETSVVVHELGKDRYDRHLGRVFCADVDVSAAMVESGSAWVYDHYADDSRLYRLQKAAKAEGRGLWADKKGAIAPWTFRYQRRQKSR